MLLVVKVCVLCKKGVIFAQADLDDDDDDAADDNNPKAARVQLRPAQKRDQMGSHAFA
jgi:hypothetical protein